MSTISKKVAKKRLKLVKKYVGMNYLNQWHKYQINKARIKNGILRIDIVVQPWQKIEFAPIIINIGNEGYSEICNHS